MKLFRILLFAAASGLLFNASCSSSSNSTPGNADAGPAGGPISGTPDDHCAGQPVGVADPAACMTAVDTGAGGAADDSTPSAAGASDCLQTHDAMYGNTLYNSEGDDDDCKYHASFTATPIRLNEDVTFTVTATNKTTGDPLTPLADGDLPLGRVEVYQPCDATRRPPAQDFVAKLAQAAPGVFTAGPFKFDQSGTWVIRFHFYEQCIDQDTSPHGHIAFFLNVP